MSNNRVAARTPSTIETLGAQLREQHLIVRQLTSLLAALLIEKHEGMAFVPMSRMAETFGNHDDPNGHLLKVETIKELGNHRIKVHMPDGTPYVHVQKPTGALEQVCEELAVEALNCANNFHRDMDAQGLLCPECGRKDKIESQEFVSA